MELVYFPFAVWNLVFNVWRNYIVGYWLLANIKYLNRVHPKKLGLSNILLCALCSVSVYWLIAPLVTFRLIQHHCRQLSVSCIIRSTCVVPQLGHLDAMRGSPNRRYFVSRTIEHP